jgi:hypothetical protein
MVALPTFFPLSFSVSSMKSLHRCSMFTFREQIQHLSGFSRSSDLIAGGHIAKACELARVAYFTEGKDEDDAIDIAKEYILNGEDTGDSVKSNEATAFALEQYFRKFRLEDSLPPCSLSDGTHAVEYRFELDTGIAHPELKDRNILFSGRLDYLCEKVVGNTVTRHGLDEKTCKSVYRVQGSKQIDYAKEADQYRVDSQILSYGFAARALGVPLTSFFIRRIPIMKDFEPAFELELPINDWQLDLWWKTTLRSIMELKETYLLYKSGGYTPEELFLPTFQEHACLSYGKTCRYLDGCLSKDGVGFLTERFSQRIWDRDKREEVELKTYLKENNIE